MHEILHIVNMGNYVSPQSIEIVELLLGAHIPSLSNHIWAQNYDARLHLVNNEGIEDLQTSD